MAEYDLLLHWMGERRNGSNDDLKASIEWTLGDEPFSQVCRKLMVLGHLEVDWERRRWCIPPPALVLLPATGLTAVVVGTRDHAARQRLAALEESEDIEVVVERRPAEHGPETIFVIADAWDSLVEAASFLGASFQPRLAFELGSSLSAIAEPDGPVLARPPDGADVFDVERVRIRRADASPALGLVVQDHFGRREAWWSRGSGWRRVDLDEGRYLELRRAGRSVLQFAPTGPTGTLVVRLGAPMPPLQSRAAALCSGLVPERTTEGEAYVNVPDEVARSIASSLGQELAIPRRTPGRR